LRVTYWLLYGYDQARGADDEELIGHEGDWQHVVVRLSRRGKGRWKPVAIELAGGVAEPVRRFAWSDVERSGSHPVVFSAKESHALYRDPGRRRRLVRLDEGVQIAYDETATCDDCSAWRTWRQLRPVRREPWYGFGGGWGLAYEGDAASGPLGPRPD
jgi:hypothetical protein